MAEKWEEAEIDYLAGMKYKEIADKYDVTLSAVKAWKSRKWTKDKVAAVTKKVVTKSQKVTEVTEVTTDNNVSQAIDELDGYDLTDKQKAFVIEYLKSFNATQAYLNVYDVDYRTANANGARMLVNASIQNAISELRKARLKDLAISEQDIIETWAKQAFADIGDYVKFGGYDQYAKIGRKKILDKNGNPIIIHSSFVQLRDMGLVDTSLIKKVTLGKDGPVIELHDQVKAQERLLEMLKNEGLGGQAESTIIVDDWNEGEEDDESEID